MTSESTTLNSLNTGLSMESKQRTSPSNQNSSSQNPSSSKQSQISSIPLHNPSSQEFCLRWNNYQTNLTSVFDQLLQNESFVDVTLACDGHSIKAHKMVLSACSPYFQALFFDNPCQHPIIIMRDVKYPEIKAIVDFMYKGEINVNQDQIGPLLRVAEMLKIRGLADVNQDQDLNSSSQSIIPDVTATPSTTTTNKSNSSNNTSSTGSSSNKKPTITARDWGEMESLETNVREGRSDGGHNNAPASSSSSSSLRNQRKRKWHLAENNNSVDSPIGGHETPDNHMETPSPLHNHPSTTPLSTPSVLKSPSTPNPMSNYPTIPAPLEAIGLSPLSHPDDMEIKPGIAEMIREEERAKLMENSHPWLGASTSTLAETLINQQTDSYQYQLQSLMQKSWYSNQHLMHHLRFRERGPLKSWRPETMAEAIFSVLKEGLSLSQAARKFDIPYPTFVLYANRVHNMLGPSIDGGTDLRPKGRGRPQRILLGLWPDEHISNVIKSVVFRDSKDFKDDPSLHLAAYGRHSPVFPFQDGAMNYSVSNNGLSAQSPLGNSDSLSPEAATAAAVAVMAGIRQQMQLAQHHSDLAANFNLPAHCNNLTIQPANGSRTTHDPKLGSPGQLMSNGGISLSRLDSPNSLHQHGIHSLPSILSGGHSQHQHSSTTPTNHSSSREGSPHNKTNQSTSKDPPTSSTPSPLSIATPRQRNLSPPIHGMGVVAPIEDDSSMDSALELSVEPSVNLAVGVSGLPYKASSRYNSSPRSENLFQEDINELVSGGSDRHSSGNNNNDSESGRNRSASRTSNFKEPSSNIKLEPIVAVSECRGE